MTTPNPHALAQSIALIMDRKPDRWPTMFAQVEEVITTAMATVRGTESVGPVTAPGPRAAHLVMDKACVGYDCDDDAHTDLCDEIESALRAARETAIEEGAKVADAMQADYARAAETPDLSPSAHKTYLACAGAAIQTARKLRSLKDQP